MSEFFFGIDIGSSATKVVVIDEKGSIVDIRQIKQAVGGNAVDNLINAIITDKPEIRNAEKTYFATGYGRVLCSIADAEKSEISCHAKGVSKLIPGVKTIIDIGGQDLKAIKLNEYGKIEEFVMNDKCAAGTGRFLEVMSNVLNVDIDELGMLDAKAEKTINISNTCTVFAESEVISYLSKNEMAANIAKGIHKSVALKAASLAKRIRYAEKVVITGGVAKNEGIVRALAEELEVPVEVPSIPQFTGALGAACFALESKYGERNK